MADLVVHVKRSQGWQQTVKIHYWETTPAAPATTWPGVDMVAEANDWYICRFTGIQAANIVFNDGAGHQTGNLRRERRAGSIPTISGMTKTPSGRRCLWSERARGAGSITRRKRSPWRVAIATM